MAITKTNRLNMTGGGVPVIVRLSQYDDDFTLVFELYSTDGTFTIPSGTTAEVRGTKSDGKGYSASATLDITNKKVTVTGDQQMTAVSGKNIFELTLWKGNKELNTANFILDVEPAALDRNTIVSESKIMELLDVTDRADDIIAAADQVVNAIDATLTQSGKAADAKKVGDEIDKLKDDLAQIEPGLSNNAKSALLACFEHVAWADSDGQSYYNTLAMALSETQIIILNTSSLSIVGIGNSQQLTATTVPSGGIVLWESSNTSVVTVSSTGLVTAVGAGTATITATSGNVSAVCNVLVSQASNLIRNWDFTQSLTDTVAGAVATTTATRNSNGLTFTEPNTYLDLGTVYSRNRTYEIDIDYIGSQYPSTSLAYRRIFAFGENGVNTSANTAGLPLPKKYGDTSWAWYTGSTWDSVAMETTGAYSIFDGKTMRIYIDGSGYAHVSSKTIGAPDSAYVTFGQSSVPLNDYSTSNAHVYAGGTSDALGNARITGIRVYEGEK